MNITELLEAQYATDVSTKTTSRNLKNFSQERGLHRFPSGSYSKVKQDSDPHLVRKSSIRSRPQHNDEGFKAFALFIIQNNYTDNIHMPRIYEVKTIKGEDGYAIDTYRIERLINGNEFKNDVIEQYARSILSEEAVEKIKKEDENNSVTFEELVRTIRLYIWWGDNTEMFASEEMLEACDIIKEAASQTGMMTDIWPNNMMFRRTHIGIQLVFSDPLYK